MSLGGILFILAVLISLILFIVFVVKTARAWGALHIVLLSVLFIECWVFMVFTAGVHQERVKATIAAAKELTRLTTVLAEVDKLRYGLAGAPEEALDAVIPVQGKLDRLTIDRGRVWRQVTFIQQSKVQDKDQVRLSLQSAVVSAPADPNNPAAATPPPSNAGRSLPQNLVVYGFHEVLSDTEQPLPSFYLGEYKVVAVEESTGSVTLEATRPLNPLHLNRIQQGTESWTLYELLPIDSHTAFVAEGSQPSDDMIFGRPDDAKIRELMADVPEEIVATYLNDGQKPREVDGPETIWNLVKLEKEFKQDVDNDQSADATISGYFDGSGRSIDVRLRRGEAVVLDPSSLRDNRVVFIESEAKKLIADGTAVLDRPVFVRPLNDYEEIFNVLADRAFQLTEKVKYYQHQSSLVSQANQDGLTMLTERQKEKQLLDADLGNYKKEVAVLETTVIEAIAELDKLKKELSRMFQEIQGRRDKLVNTTR